MAFAGLPVLAGQCLAGPPLAAVQKTVVDGYGKVDRLSIGCFVYERVVGDVGQLCMGVIGYRYDRSTKQLAIGDDTGIPVLLVKGSRLFVVAFWDLDNEIPTYLAIDKATPITWRDVDEALRIVRTHCPLAEPTENRLPCFVLPFLEGGTKRLFARTTEVLAEKDPEGAWVFAAGHPDSPQPLSIRRDDQPKLDPKKSPLCIRTKDDSSTWTYAFDRDAGTMTAARGVVGSEQVLGFPGRQVEVLLKRMHPLNRDSDDPHETSFDLPKNARVVRVVNLRAEYLDETRKIGRETLLNRAREENAILKLVTERESHLAAHIAQERSTATANPEQLKKDESELAEARADKARISFIANALQTLIDEIQAGEKNRNLRKH